ncbi:MAG: hypothetical protein JXB38_08615 [Anaerolineales bacterium]|nr:hypothetical protein [Anaerolineales bacterium]
MAALPGIAALLPDLDEVAEVGALVGEVTGVLLALIAGFLGVRVFITIVTGQIDLAAGKPGALADIAAELVGAIFLLAIAAEAGQIGAQAAAVVSAAAPVTGEEVVALLGKVVIDPLLAIAASLAIALTVVAVTLAALRGQLAALTGGSGRLADSLQMAAAAVLLLTVGLLAVRVGAGLLLK